MPGSSDELVPYDNQDTPGLRIDSVTDTRSVVDQILVDCPDMVLREVGIGSWPLYFLEGGSELTSYAGVSCCSM